VDVLQRRGQYISKNVNESVSSEVVHVNDNLTGSPSAGNTATNPFKSHTDGCMLHEGRVNKIGPCPSNSSTSSVNVSPAYHDSFLCVKGVSVCLPTCLYQCSKINRIKITGLM
jgi:hypothetical protein